MSLAFTQEDFLVVEMSRDKTTACEVFVSVGLQWPQAQLRQCIATSSFLNL